MSARPLAAYAGGGDESTTLANFAELIGAELALKLSMTYGGRTLYIPKTPPPHSLLVVTIGLDAAQALARRYGGVRFVVPIESGRRARIIHLRCVRGLSVPVVARQVGCTERHVYQVQAEWRQSGGSLEGLPVLNEGPSYEQLPLWPEP